MISTTEADGLTRQMVICCDGTNNTLTAGRADTHVLRLFEHLKQHPTRRRVLYYDPGIGSAGGAPPTDPGDWLMRTIERLSGLASGRGIYENISQAYLFLVRHYRSERDQIHLFGFSRGAFTVRCVAGMVHLFGIIDAEHELMLPTLIRVYFSQPEQRSGWMRGAMRGLHGAVAHAPVGRDALARQIRNDFTSLPGREAWVHWVGVWDTVESVGMPGPFSRTNPSVAVLHGKRIRHVRHALAFDEHRWSFRPRLYEERGDMNLLTPQTLKQRWFPGGHCDVGGSYAVGHAALSEATLAWMVDEAIVCGLGVPPMPPRAATAMRHDALWDVPWWALAGMCLRDMRPRTSKDGTSRKDIPMEVIPGPTVEAPIASVWSRQRSPVSLVIALFFGSLFLLRSGDSLIGAGWASLFAPGTWQPAAWAAMRFAQEQLVGPAHQWLWLVRHYDPAPVVWAMFWDLGFIACWGYLLARVSSRSFAWLAGTRSPGMPMPAWRFLGFAPLAAVGGDVCEDLLTLAAFAAHGAGTDSSAKILLALCAGAGLVKFAGALACVPWLLLRVWIAMPWVRHGSTDLPRSHPLA